MEFLFTIFHRLNTGGMKLNNQEIRNCIFGGPLNTLLKELDQNKNWRMINKMKKDLSYRFTKQELILRFLAFNERKSKYEGHLAKFLNDFMHDFRYPSGNFMASNRKLFEETTEQISIKIFESKPPKKLPITILESLMIGVATNLDHVKGVSVAKMQQKYGTLLASPTFSEAALREGLSKKPRVSERLDVAIEIFSR
jgi:hypothetical protein